MIGRAALALLFAIQLALVICGCGGDATAPKISMLRISPETGVHPSEVLTATIDFTDDDGDLPGGRAEIGLRRKEEPEGELIKVDLAGGGGSSSKGSITLMVHLPGGTIPGHYDLSVTVIDSSGRRSNPLVTEFDVLP